MIPLEVPVELTREEARQRILAELDKAKYGELPDWLMRLLENLADVMVRIVEFALGIGAGPSGSGSSMSIGFVIVLIVLVAAIAVLVWKVGLPRWRRRQRDAEVELEPDAIPDDYRSAAERAAGTGDFRSAVRDRFRAVVKELEVMTVLDPRPARTAWEAATTTGRALPALAGPMHSGAESFSAVMYGDRMADRAAYEAMVALDQQVSAAAGEADLTGSEQADAHPGTAPDRAGHR